ncbi:MAG: nucleotidyltransferase family protein [Desulfobacteraceae bacterium]|nr:nucleotidyltransferase family protein [Desulfobacteraceae bacterium]
MQSLKESNPEMAFVLACAFAEPDSKQYEKMLNIAGKISDWEQVYEISLTQRLLPLLYMNIKNHLHSAVPDEVVNRFKKAYINIAADNLYLTSHLLKVVSLLKKSGIAAVPVKGPITAQELYGDIGMRPFSDIDIIVNKDDALKAWQILLENGFQPEVKLTIAQFRKYIIHEDNLSFAKDKGSIHIELHWEMSGWYLNRPLKLNDVEMAEKKIQIESQKITRLSPEYLLLYLCVHGAKHGWVYLEQLSCIAHIVLKHEINWEQLNGMAVKWRCKRILELGLFLIWDLFDVPVPASITDAFKHDKTMMHLAGTVIQNVSEYPFDRGKINKLSRFSLFHVHIRDRFRDKLNYVFRLAFCPTKSDWLSFALPAQLFFLYYLLRPCRLVTSKLKGQTA